MRIALVTYALEVGGVETVLRLLAGHFRERGHEVRIVETLRRGSWSASFSAAGFDVAGVLPRPLRSAVAHARRLAAALEPFDLLLLNDAPVAQAVACQMPESTVVMPVLHMAMESMLRNAVGDGGCWDALVAVSPAARAAAIGHGAPADRVVCVPNGVPVADRWPREGRASAPHGTLELVSVGAIRDRQKGVLLLPEVLERARRAGADVRLTIVGDGPDLPALRRLAEAVPSGALRLVGALPNVEARAVLAAADALVMPSRFEGLSVVLLEAMALGVVPVVSRLPGSTDVVVRDGENGLLVPVDDVAGFAAAVATLAGDRQRLAEMSQRAWATISASYSSRRMADAYLELYEACRKRRGAGAGPRRGGGLRRGLLGEHPGVPVVLRRPIRKALRLLGHAGPPRGVAPGER